MYNVVISEHFKRQLKREVKKNPMLKERLKETLLRFDRTLATSIGMGVYKIRLPGFNAGKSGGYGLYVFVVEVDHLLAPICLYAKSNIESLSLDEVTWHLEQVTEELKQCGM